MALAKTIFLLQETYGTTIMENYQGYIEKKKKKRINLTGAKCEMAGHFSPVDHSS